MNDLYIASSANDEFVPHLAILFTSVVKNCTHPVNFHFFVLDDDISEKNKAALNKLFTRDNSAIAFLSINQQHFDHVVESKRIPKASYYRIELPRLFKNTDVQKVIYLDCDMVVVEDICSLAAKDLGNSIIGAVEDAGFHHRLEKMEILSKTNRYFNAGLQVIDVQKWNDEEITEQVFHFIKQYPEKLRFHDQDALNAVLCDRWHLLHPQWNVQTAMVDGSKLPDDQELKTQFEKARNNPKIIHYCGHTKPWHSEFNLITGKYYHKYKQMIKIF